MTKRDSKCGHVSNPSLSNGSPWRLGRASAAEASSEAKQIALARLAILRACHLRTAQPEINKTQAMRDFILDFNSGIFSINE